MIKSAADIIYAAIVGDAAGYTLGGMKKNHIKAVFKDISDYVDPAPGLKNSMHKWRKPGLYSSISQNILLIAANTENKGFNLRGFINSIKDSPEVAGSELGIFREPGDTEKNFISRFKSGEEWNNQFNRGCSRILPAMIPLMLIKNSENRITSAIKLISTLTKNSSVIAYSVMLLNLLEHLLLSDSGTILETACQSAYSASDLITRQQKLIFESGINPDYIISEALTIIKLFDELKRTDNKAEYESVICRHAEMRDGSPVTRGSVNLPETVLPMAVLLSDATPGTESIYLTAASEGGASSPLSSLSGAITTARYGLNLPEKLSENLINKKRIRSYMDIIASGKDRTTIINTFFETEPALTLKELEEQKARNRNKPNPKEKKKNKPAGKIESELSRHVVESWTKLDKAKWKKERKKGNI